MTMHEHDQELIMALAEGTLAEGVAATAAAEISECLECTRDLQLQRIALSALDEAPAVYLTATESSQLHSRLRQELEFDVAQPAKPKRALVWGRWLPAVGIAAVFLVAIVSLQNLGGGDDDSSTEMAALEMTTTAEATETTAAAAEALPPSDATRDGTETLQAAESEEVAGGADTTASPETTVAADTATTTTTGLMEGGDAVVFLGLIDELDREVLLEQLASEFDELFARSEVARDIDPFVSSCLDSNASPTIAPTLGIPLESEPLLLGSVVDASGEEFLLVAYVPEDIGGTVFVTQRSYSCEIIAVLF